MEMQILLTCAGLEPLFFRLGRHIHLLHFNILRMNEILKVHDNGFKKD
jgi:hypothetical protein